MPTVADHLLDLLTAWKVKRIFCYPGDGINGIMGSLRRATSNGNSSFDVIQAAHEELAALMATAHAKFTGNVGVCLVTSGPGAIHALNGLYDAKLDHQPVVAIVGQQAFAGVGASSQQETNLRSILSDVASSYLETVSKPEQLRHIVDRAFRAAIGGRTVAAIIIPHDIQCETAEPQPKHEHGRQHSAPGFSPPRIVARDEELQRAADVLNAGRKVAIIAGAGALAATDEVIAIAERLGAGIAKSLLGKACVPDDHPLVTGSAGWLGTSASNTMLKECDTLLMIGSNFPYTEFLPEEGKARGVQIDVEPRNLSLRYPMEVALAGDSVDTLRALLPLLNERQTDDTWRREIVQSIAMSRTENEDHAHAQATPLNPQLVVSELSKRLPDRSIVTADSGSSTVWMARQIMLRRDMMASVSGGLATMGCGLPYALAAKLEYPDRPVFALIGDGAMQMSGFSALLDVAKHWERGKSIGRLWSNPFVVVVFNNCDLNYVTWEQRVMEGEPRYVETQKLPDVHYAEYAKLIGLDGVRAEGPDEVPDAWERALASNAPFVIDAVVDRNMPTLPPELTEKQQKSLAKALGDGDADAAEILVHLELQNIELASE